MNVLTLKAEPISKEAFAPFGTLIELEGAEAFPINGGTTMRFHALATMDVAKDRGEPILSVFRASVREQPIYINMLERHPLGSQAFVPMGLNLPWVVVVARAEQPTASDCKAFVVGPKQGVQYRRNIWHHPLLSLDDQAEFLVADRMGPGNNLDEIYFDHSICQLSLPSGATN